MSLAQKLKFIRKVEKLSQARFAKMVGLSESSLKSWETEAQIMGADKLLKIINNPRFAKYARLLVDDNYTRFQYAGESAARGELIFSKNEHDINLDKYQIVELKLGTLDPEDLEQVLQYIDFLSYSKNRDDL